MKTASTRWLKTVRDGALGLVYPRVCVGCELPLEADGELWLCENCKPELKPVEPPYCDTCGQPFDGVMARGFRCSNCREIDLAFDFAVGAYRAEGLARELVHRFKYEKQHYLCALLGEMLRDALSDDRLNGEPEKDWLLVPVPLHPRRLREREFNQAAELCRVFRREGRPAGFEYGDLLKRTRYTRRQANLDRADRLTNLEGAFAMRRDGVRGRPVLLVDDVLTTGATASECARVLREEGGASKVVVITVVRG